MAISGQKTIAIAGVEEALGSGPCLANLMIKALDGNTGIIFIGNSGVDLGLGLVTSDTGQQLDPGESLVIETASFESVFIDSAIHGDGVSWILLTI